MKQTVVFQNLVNSTNEECQLMDEATAKMKTEVPRSNVLALELHVFHVMLLQYLSNKSSIHNIFNCVTI